MGVIKRQAFQSSILLYTGTIIGFLTTGLMAPNLLTQSEIGTLRLLQSYASIITTFGVLGFTTVTIRFIPRFWNDVARNYNGFFGLVLIVGFVGSIVATLIIFLIKPTIIENNLDKSPEFAKYFILIIPLSIFQIYYALFDAYNNALLKSSFGVFLRDFVQRLLILAGLSLILVNLVEFDFYVYYFVAVLSAPTLFALIYIIYLKAFDWRINFDFLQKPLLRSMFSVSLFGLLNSFSYMAVLQIDTIMLNMYFDSTTVGIYAITFFFGTLVFIPAKALIKIAPSLISQAYKEKDLDTVKDVYYRSTGNLFLIGALVFVGLLVNLENVFNIIPKSYLDGKYVIVIIGLANLIKMAGGTNDSVINYSKYYKMTTLFLVILIVLVIGFNFIFIPLYGLTGAAIASCLAVLVHNLIKSSFIQLKLGMNPYNLQFAVVLIICGVDYLLVSLLPAFNNFIFEILIDSLAATILFYIGVRFLPLSNDINTLLRQLYDRGLKLFRSKNK